MSAIDLLLRKKGKSGRNLYTIREVSMFDRLRERGYDVLMLHHAEAILRQDMGTAADDLESTLLALKIPVVELVAGGGGEALVTQRLRRELTGDGWHKRNITIEKSMKLDENAVPKVLASTSHEIDHVKTFNNWTFALEIEWNNKDPFYDRDLENFKRLHAEGAISVGGLITRGESLHLNMRQLVRRFADDKGINAVEQLEEYRYFPTHRQKQMIEARANRLDDFRQGWAEVFTSDKFGEATTHWRKLLTRVERGVGNPCPLVLIGIPDTVIAFDYSEPDDIAAEL